MVRYVDIKKCDPAKNKKKQGVILKLTVVPPDSEKKKQVVYQFEYPEEAQAASTVAFVNMQLQLAG